jgi:signal transduction histidine kinase
MLGFLRLVRFLTLRRRQTGIVRGFPRLGEPRFKLGNAPLGRLKALPESADQGILLFRTPDPDMVYTAFNVRDPVIGGLSKEKIGRIFKPFSRVDNRYDSENGGTGLGLAISKL